MKEQLIAYRPGLLLLTITFIIGIISYKDYGVSWDEPLQRDLGTVTYNYVFNGDATLKTYGDRALGSGFELPLVVMEKCLHLKDPRDVYLARHLATHIFFLLSVFCGYVLALRLFKNQFVACLAFILLAFEPRIYAHSYFNSKDVPFLSAFLIAMLVCQVAFEKKRYGWHLLLGIACGYATSIRAMGIIFLPLIGLFLLVDFINHVISKKQVVPPMLKIIAFFSGFCGMLYIAWPYLWAAPYHNFFGAFHDLKNINAGLVLFNGERYNGNHLPWIYMPEWFSITVPELWLATGLAGFVWIIIGCVRMPRQYVSNSMERNYLLYAACFAVPIAAMIIFNGANIDDWRHLYFIYPSFVMMSLYVIHKLMQGKAKLPVQLLCVAQIVITSWFMVCNHPFQQVYFNSLISHKKEYLRDNFDLEYWGCSFKQGLDHLVATNKSDSIKIDWAIQPLPNNIALLPEADRKRIFLIDDHTGADYIITNFRGNRKVEYPGLKEEYSIHVLNSTIMCIYKAH